jgi:hypothetical protein
MRDPALPDLSRRSRADSAARLAGWPAEHGRVANWQQIILSLAGDEIILLLTPEEMAA